MDQFWKRVTEGLELSQLWAQFKAEARVSYRLYQRDFDARAPQESRRHNVLHTVQEFLWAVLGKLSPARRVMLLLAVVMLLMGGAGFSYNAGNGEVRSVGFDLHFYGGALLLLLLVLEVADRVTMKRDLEIARDIQQWLLPSEPPAVPGVRLAFATRPANTVAGDFYDVFPRPAAGPGQPAFLVAVADVAGKSIPAALLMATFQASLRTLASVPCSLEELVAGMNRYACTNSQGGLRFTTAFVAEYEPGSRTLNYINAGHNPPMLRRAGGGFDRLTHGGLPLGIQEGASYEPGSLVLEPGDTMLVFTDGLVEAEDAAANEFGEDRVMALLQANPEASPSGLLAKITSSLEAFVGATPQHDDITCLILRVD
jgi:serine phosphatase RsbU (regulator of sigma subunit)